MRRDSACAAVRRLGYRHTRPVQHRVTFRDAETGFHTNDVESENNRIKRFLRKRYGYLKLGRYKQIDNDTALDLYEYVFYVNIGSQMSDVMKALAASVVADVETGPGRGGWGCP